MLKNQMFYFKTLISYLESSLWADKKSYKDHDYLKHLSRVIALESCKKWEKTYLYQKLLSLSRQVRGAVTLEVRNASPEFSYDF